MLLFLVRSIDRGCIYALDDIAAVVSDNAAREFFAVNSSCGCAFENRACRSVFADDAADSIGRSDLSAEFAVVDNALVRACDAAYRAFTA